MSLFNIIGKDCEDIIYNYKEQMEDYEKKQDFKYRKSFQNVLLQFKYENVIKLRDKNKSVAVKEYNDWVDGWYKYWQYN